MLMPMQQQQGQDNILSLGVFKQTHHRIIRETSLGHKVAKKKGDVL